MVRKCPISAGFTLCVCISGGCKDQNISIRSPVTCFYNSNKFHLLLVTKMTILNISFLTTLIFFISLIKCWTFLTPCIFTVKSLKWCFKSCILRTKIILFIHSLRLNYYCCCKYTSLNYILKVCINMKF